MYSVLPTCSLSYHYCRLFTFLYALAILILNFISIGTLKTALHFQKRIQTGIQATEDQRQLSFTENEALCIIV